jgi:hypothetical protein
LFGGSRQVYYRRAKSEANSNLKAQEAISLVQGIRHQLPRVGTRKLYHMLQEPLQALHIGRDSLFAIMKANHLDIKPKRQYRVTTNSHHRFPLAFTPLPITPLSLFLSLHYSIFLEFNLEQEYKNFFYRYRLLAY